MCEREHPRLVRALDLWSGDLALAEAVAEDALVALWRRWPAGRRPTWLYEVALDLIRDRPVRPDFDPAQAEDRRALARMEADDRWHHIVLDLVGLDLVTISDESPYAD
jgi:DNA-directed RNA polymerase specialized sigma24 family protein